MIQDVSGLNAVYMEMTEQKNQRKNLTDAIDSRKAKVIHFLRHHGPVLVYKNDKAVILEAVKGTVKKFDKASLGADLGIPAGQLNAMKIARLVEQNRLTTKKLKEYQYEEEEYKLKQRKAKKKELAQFQNQK